MTKPFFGKLRRTYSPGIWLHIRDSMSLTHLQGYVHRIQVEILRSLLLNSTWRWNETRLFVISGGQPSSQHHVPRGFTLELAEECYQLRWEPQTEALHRIRVFKTEKAELRCLQVRRFFPGGFIRANRFAIIRCYNRTFVAEVYVL